MKPEDETRAIRLLRFIADGGTVVLPAAISEASAGKLVLRRATPPYDEVGRESKRVLGALKALDYVTDDMKLTELGVARLEEGK